MPLDLDLRDCTDITPSFQRLHLAASKYKLSSADNEEAVIHIDSAIYKIAREIHPPELIEQWEQAREKKLRKWMLTTPGALQKMQQALKGTAYGVAEKLEQKVNLFIRDFDKQAASLNCDNNCTTMAKWLEHNACYLKGFSDEGIPLNDSQMQLLVDKLKKLESITKGLQSIEAKSLHLQVRKLIRTFPYEPAEQQSKVRSWFKLLMNV